MKYRLRLLVKPLVKLTVISLSGLLCGAWSPHFQKEYEHRDFISLEQEFTGRGQVQIAKGMSNQAIDLEGCRAVDQGRGGSRAVMKCMTFLNREQNLGFSSRGRSHIAQDLNILCAKLARAPSSMRGFLSSGLFKDAPDKRTWKVCVGTLWEQVYLTAYANFDADPIKSLAFVRLAERNLPPTGPFPEKLSALVKAH